MRLFKKITINKEKRKINLRRILIRECRPRRRKVINLYERNRRITISNQIRTNTLRRLFIINAKISNIIKSFVNVYNMKRAMKFANKTLIKKKLKSNIRRRRIRFDFY